MSGITPCLWFDGDAEEAAKFYASLFPNSHVDAVHRAPSDYPSGNRDRAKRAFDAMMQMKRIDIAAIERAADGIGLST